MRNLLTTVSFLTLLLLVQGCVKDNCKGTKSYTFFEPVYKTKAEVRANVRSNAPRSVERPGKLFIRGHYIFLSEIDRGIHVINNSDPAHPRNIAFIDIPGTMDLAVKGNTLYADMFVDLVAIDITDPTQVRPTKFVQGVFPHRAWGSTFQADTSQMIVEWVRKDTTLETDCYGKRNWLTGMMASDVANLSGPSAGSPYGMGGSMARFTILNERLYTVGTADLSVFNIANPVEPGFVTKKQIGFGIETIYPFKGNLFIGSTSGMFIFNTAIPDNPTQTGTFSHVRSCDPVIADDTHAYVTLRSGTACQGFTNQMEVLKLSQTVGNPTLVKTYPLTNPHGLSKDGNLLFVCDGKDGLKTYDATDPASLQLLSTVSQLETSDAIAFNGVVLVVAKDGLYQYDYSNPRNLRLLSKIAKTL